MFKIKFLTSIIIFSSLLFGTSIIKNQSRELEKNIYNLSKKINLIEKDLNESQLDFSYLTSPSILENKIELIDHQDYITMNYSKIFPSLLTFINFKNSIATKDNYNEEKLKKNKNFNPDQRSFFFEDYLETNKKEINPQKK